MCTALTYVTKDHYFGRNFDYDVSYKEVVTITPRNYQLKFRKVSEIDHHYAMIGIAAGVAAGVEVWAIKDYRFGMDQGAAKGLLDNLIDVLDLLK